MPFGDAYRGKRVLVTGHTGFKGSWLALWLTHLGAEVAGYSDDVPTTPAHFTLLDLPARLRHFEGDIRDRARLLWAFDEFKPDAVFHLAAQALVRRSYADPALTFEVNTMGMVNVLECVRAHPRVQAAVLITSDKAYRNDEVVWGYRETDPMGGLDPYGGSKSCADLVAQSYLHSFLANAPTQIAVTRAGNVIGGGDWAPDRIVPDCVRAWSTGATATIRNPRATRPWQHVLEPLGGYLWLGARLLAGADNVHGEAFNFGPGAEVNQTVGELLAAMVERWPGARWEATGGDGTAKEATLLKLSCDKALHHLRWHAVLSFEQTVAMTVDWYREWSEKRSDTVDRSLGQIDDYCQLARARGLAWTA